MNWNIDMDALTSQIELSEETLRMTTSCSVYSTWWSKFESYLPSNSKAVANAPVPVMNIKEPVNLKL